MTVSGMHAPVILKEHNSQKSGIQHLVENVFALVPVTFYVLVVCWFVHVQLLQINDIISAILASKKQK